MNCPGCGQPVALRTPDGGYVPPEVWHLNCFDAEQAVTQIKEPNQ